MPFSHRNLSCYKNKTFKYISQTRFNKLCHFLYKIQEVFLDKNPLISNLCPPINEIMLVFVFKSITDKTFENLFNICTFLIKDLPNKSCNFPTSSLSNHHRLSISGIRGIHVAMRLCQTSQLEHC